MFFRIYKYNHPIIILLIFISAILLWLLVFLKASQLNSLSYNFEMPLYYWIFQYLGNKPLILRIVSLLLILFQAIQINRINTKFFLLETRSYLPSFLFILGCSVLPLQNMHSILFASIFLLFAIDRLFVTYRNDKAWMKYFDSGLLISIGSLFYIKLIFFIPIIWIALLILRPFRGREWLLSIIGFLLPYLFVASYFYIFEDNLLYRFNLFLSYLFDFDYIANFHYTYISQLVFLVLLILFSSYKIIVTLQKRKVSIRKFFQLFFWLFVISFLMFTSCGFLATEILLLINISLVFIFSNLILSLKSAFWTEVILTIYIGIIVSVQLYNYTNILP